MDVFLLLLGGSFATILGFLLGRQSGKRELPPPEPKPSLICGCDHELSYHDLKTGQCHETIPGETVWRAGKYQTSKVRCNCRQYTGARPLETYWSPQIYTGDED